MLTAVVDTVRSELIRTRRKGVLVGWFGLSAVFAFLINSVMFQVAGDDTAAPTSGPGVSFPGAAELAQPDGLVAGLSAAAGMFGVLALSFWALITAADYSSGLVRLLVSIQPRRWRLLAGKIVALVGWTAAATTVALVANVLAAPVAARGSGIDVSAWREDTMATLAGGWFNLFCTLLVWGVIGLTLAVVTRSSAVAISVGIGYVLVIESVLSRAVTEDVGRWLPGATLSALAHGGTGALGYGAALACGVGYAVAGIVIAQSIFTRRDITD